MDRSAFWIAISDAGRNSLCRYSFGNPTAFYARKKRKYAPGFGRCGKYSSFHRTGTGKPKRSESVCDFNCEHSQQRFRIGLGSCKRSHCTSRRSSAWSYGLDGRNDELARRNHEQFTVRIGRGTHRYFPDDGCLLSIL